jgi:serine/threonine protein phosphatase 1
MTAIPAAPRRLYVIGDIHGRSDLLERMIGLIGRDLGRAEADDCLTVTVGDYIDRGPDSRGVIERLARSPFPTPYIPLKGNHEEFLEVFLREPEAGRHWRQNGGLETLRSYGIQMGGLMLGRQLEAASQALLVALPDHHARFLSSLTLCLDLDRYFICHAGVRPGVALDQQSSDDLLWIREEFLLSHRDFGKRVIHGHTPMEEPEVLPNRINVDTGAFATGRLTCAVLEGGEVRFLVAT